MVDQIAKELAVHDLAEYQPDDTGGDTFLDDMPERDGLTIALYSRGGLEPDAGLGYDDARVQVVVRGGDRDPRPPFDRARAIYAYLHGLHHHALPDGTFLVGAAADQSDPVRIGPDEHGRHSYGVNLTCHVRAATTHRE